MEKNQNEIFSNLKSSFEEVVAEVAKELKQNSETYEDVLKRLGTREWKTKDILEQLVYSEASKLIRTEMHKKAIVK